MPSRGDDGRPLSNAALRRRKKAQEAEEKASEERRKAAPLGLDDLKGMDFSSLPPPPLGDPIGAMGWWNDVLMVCAHRVICDPHMPLEKRVRFLADMSAKAGMIRDKAAESRDIREALRKKAKAAEETGLERAGPAPPQVPRPAG